MKAVRFHEYGTPDVLRVEEVDRPAPDAGQVLVRVAATSFNSVDGNIRGGFMQGPIPVALPHTPGIDVAGTIEGLGRGVDGLAVGDRVIGLLPMGAPGAAADFVVAPAEVLTRAPADLPLPDSAALPVVGLTAWQALFELGGLVAGQRVLINGAGGAVGGHAVQLARRAGAHVIAVASPRSAARARADGADVVVDATVAPADAVTGQVDLVVNLAPVEPAQLAALITLVRPGGVLVNTTVWMPAPSDQERGVRGIDMYVRSDAAQLAHLVALVDRGELRVDIAQRVRLTDLAEVHAQAAAGLLPSGKTVVLPA